MSDSARDPKTGQFRPGHTGNRHGRRGRTDATEIAAKPYVREDGFANPQLSIGFGPNDRRMAATYVPDVLSVTELTNAWRSSDLIDRLVSTLPREALARGFELQIEGESSFDDLRERTEQILDDLGALDALEKCLQMERAFGCSALLIGADDGLPLDQELSVSAVSDVLYLSPLEPHELVPLREYTDPTHPRYGRTSHWQLVRSMTMTGDPLGRTLPDAPVIHESRLLMFPGVRVSKNTHGMIATWGGDPVIVRAWRAIADFDQAFASVGLCLTSHGTPIVKLRDLAKMINAGRIDVIRARLALVLQTMSAARAAVMDSEESYERQGVPLTGLAEILDRIAMRIAAACEMPITKLMGQSPKGLGNEGESDMATWAGNVSVFQRQRCRGPLHRLASIAMASTRMPLPDRFAVKFPPLSTPSELEKAQTRQTMAEADARMIEVGVLTPDSVARARFQGEYSLETPISSEELDDRDAMTALDREPATDEDREALTLPTPTSNTGATANAPAPVSNSALNGAQVAALVSICQSQALGQLARESAKAIILAAFPTVTPEQAEAMLPEGFKPTTPTPTTPTAPNEPKPTPTNEPMPTTPEPTNEDPK